MAASTALSRWICFRFQILKAINAAAGSTMASSSVRSVFVRSVKRHFLDISNLVRFFTRPLHWQDYKGLSARVVKPPQMIVKSCKRGRCVQLPTKQSRSALCQRPEFGFDRRVDGGVPYQDVSAFN